MPIVTGYDRSVLGAAGPGSRDLSLVPTEVVRLHAGRRAAEVFGDPSLPLVRPLWLAGGIVSFETPRLGFEIGGQWRENLPIHSDTPWQDHGHTAAPRISLTLRYGLRTLEEGAYVAAVVHFLRSATHSHFGTREPASIRGYGPDGLLLTGLGPALLDDVPVLLDHWSATWPPDAAWVEIPFDGTVPSWYLPVTLDISLDLITWRAPDAWIAEWTLEGMRSGTLRSYGWL